MAVTSCSALADLLAKSGIVAPGDPGVQAALESTADPREAAKRLIAEGRITRWQAQQLLAGRHQLFLGKYKLLDKLGEGGMGAVYKAEQTGMRRLVAVKVMSQDVLKDEGAAGRFHREIRSVSALNHPNIIAAIDADRHGSAHFLVMEFVAGRDLKAWIEEYGRLPVDWACECIRQAALGLQHAHEKGLVHRDIKPGNLLVVGSGTDSLPQIKILDMGLARFTSEAQCTQLTKTGQVLGTIDYISPEQARDTKGADIRADVFSLGCTLFRMLTGEVPYTGRNPVEKLMARAMKDAPLVRSLAPELPPALERVIATMLARKPEDRYQTPQEVAEALAPFAAGTAGASEASSSLNLPAIDQAETGPGSTIQGEADQTLNAFLTGLSDGDKAPRESLAPPSEESPADEPSATEGEYESPVSAARGLNLPVVGGGIAALVALVVAALVLMRGGDDPALAKGKEPAPKGKREPAKTSPAKIPPAPLDFALEFGRGGQVSRANMPSLKVGPSQVATLEARVMPLDRNGQNTSLFTINSVNIRNETGRWAAVYWRAKEGVEILSGPPVEIGRMVHVAVVCDQAKLRLFVDGVPSGAADLRASPPTTSTPDFAIGWDFAGVVDEVRVSKTARYDGPFRAPVRFESDADTLALYHFDEGQGDQVKDASGNGHHGKLTPTVKWVKSPPWNPPPVSVPSDPPEVAPSALHSDFALELSGGGRVDLPMSLKYDPLGPLTVEAYVNLTDPTRRPNRPQFAWVFSGPPYLALNANLGAAIWQLQLSSANASSSASGTLVSNRRIHLAGVYQGKELRVFVDGKMHRGAVKHELLTTFKDPCRLGQNFVGTIDEVHISKSARYDRDFSPASRFEPDGETLALYHCDEGKGETLKDSSGNGHDGKILGAKWVPVAGAQPTAPRATAVTLDPAGTLAGNATDLATIAWSPDGKAAATGGNLGQLTFWDVTRQAMDHSFKAPETGAIRQLRFSPDGKRLYSASTSGTIREWNWETRESTAKTEGTAFDLSQDGTMLVAGSAGSGTIKMIDTTTRASFVNWKGDPPLALSSDRRKLAATSGSTILIYDLKSGGQPVELKSSQKNPQELAFSPDGSSLAVGWLEEGLEVWSLETHTLLAGPIKVPGGTAWLAWSPDGRVLMHGIPQGGVLYFFEPRGGAHVGTYNPKMGGIARGVFRRDGTQILVCSNHREAKRFDVRIDPPTDKVVSESPAAPPPAKAPFDVPQARAHQQAWAKHLGTTVQTANSIGGKLALIPPGEFLMGTSDAEIEKLLEAGAKKGVLRGHLDRIRDLEGPQHRVVLTRPFWMATTETTGGQFRKFIESSGYVTEAEKYGFGNSSLKVANDTVTPEMRTLSWKSRGTPDDSPVGEVTWNDAVAFCNWLSVQEKRQACYRPEPKTAAGWALVPGADGYRLPTEAEWEFACRAGTTWWYFFGDELKTLEGYASLAANRPVGSKLPNGFGLYDLYGSVWEMCQDFDGRSYADSPLEDPTGVPTGTARIIRGGAANSTPLHLRSAYRGTMHQSYRNSAYGFRYVRGVAADEAAR